MHIYPLLLLTAFSALGPVNVRAQLSDREIGQLVKELAAALNDEGDEHLQAVASQVVAVAERSIPLMREAAKALPPRARQGLVWAAGQISGTNATQLLLEVALSDRDPNVSSTALGHLQARRLGRTFTEQEIADILLNIEAKPIMVAGSWARILSASPSIDTPRVLDPMLARFISEAENPSPEATLPVMHAYVSGEVFVLNQCLLAFSALDHRRVLPALEIKAKEAINPSVGKWITIARGIVHDLSVTNELVQIVRNESEDVGLRATALRAYARAAGAAAVPLLEAFRNDQTKGPHPRWPPLSIVAKGELATLQESK